MKACMRFNQRFPRMIMEIGVQYSGRSRALPLAALAEMCDTISTLIPVELAGSFGDGRCCHPSGYLQIDGIRRSGGRCHIFEAAACPAGYRTRPHGLGCPRSFDSLAPSSACPFGSRHCGIYPGLSQGPVLPSPSPKFLRQFHQTNRVNGISMAGWMVWNDLGEA
jgi:hypothetical protein